MLLLASGMLHSEEYSLSLIIFKRGVRFVPVGGGLAAATLKFLLSVKYLYVNRAYFEKGIY